MTFSTSRIVADIFAEATLDASDMDEKQVLLADFMIENPRSFVLAEMGFGKTGTTLNVLDRLLSIGITEANALSLEKPLIVAPLRVARNTWPREFRKWRFAAPWGRVLIRAEDDDPEVKEAGRRIYQLARSMGASPKEAQQLAGLGQTEAKELLRDKLRHASETITIINQEQVPWLQEAWGKRWPYDALIFDEATRLRDPGSATFKALKRVRRRFKRIHLLTAIPAPQSMQPIFAMTYMLDDGARFGASKGRFEEQYFTENRYTREVTIKPGARDKILEKIADISIVLKEDIDPFKPIIRRRWVEMTPAEDAQYQEFEREAILTLATGEEIEATHAGHLGQKLLQLASGAVYNVKMEESPESEVLKKVKQTHYIHQHKIKELQQLVEELNGQPVMVAYWFKSTLAMLKKTFPKAEVLDSRASQEPRWNAGKIKMLLVHPMGAAHGLNLQDGGHHLVIFDLFHAVELFMQLYKRLARRGQMFQVYVHLLCMKGTLDVEVADKLEMLEEEVHDGLRTLAKMIARLRGWRK